MSVAEEQENVLQDALSAIIRNAYFDARNAGQTMYQAGDDAAAQVLSVLTPSALRLQTEVDRLLTQWENDRRSYPADWQGTVADAVLTACIDELRAVVQRATPQMPRLESVSQPG